MINLKKLTSQQLLELSNKICVELGVRREEEFMKKDKCPSCYGGYTGTEQDHYPCGRCRTTGKYFKLQ